MEGEAASPMQPRCPCRAFKPWPWTPAPYANLSLSLPVWPSSCCLVQARVFCYAMGGAALVLAPGEHMVPQLLPVAGLHAAVSGGTVQLLAAHGASLAAVGTYTLSLSRVGSVADDEPPSWDSL
jgi:hypothetical protein